LWEEVDEVCGKKWMKFVGSYRGSGKFCGSMGL